MSSEVAVRPDLRVAPIAKSFDEMMRVAESLLKSGFLPQSIKTPAQAVAIILMGREVGLPEMQALRSINVIQGKPTLSAELMLALFSARVNGQAKIVKLDDTECVIKFQRPGRAPHVERFTIEQARKMGLSTKDNYAKQVATMLRWRCVSAGLRFYAPDAIAGISYTPDELGAVVNGDTGEVIDISGMVEVEDVPTVDVRADVAKTSTERLKARVRASGEAPKISAEDLKYVQAMQGQKKRLGSPLYYATLGAAGFCHCTEILDRPTRESVYAELKRLEPVAVEREPGDESP
jgi:hypothetical protein